MPPSVLKPAAPRSRRRSCWSIVTVVVRSLRLAARRLAHARGFTIAAILTLALGLGGTTTVFSVVNAVLLRPLPYPAPDRLVSLSHTLVVGGVLRVDQTGCEHPVLSASQPGLHAPRRLPGIRGWRGVRERHRCRARAGRPRHGRCVPSLAGVADPRPCLRRVRRSAGRGARRGHRRTAVGTQVRPGSGRAESPDRRRRRAPRSHRHHAGRRSFSVAGHRPLAARCAWIRRRRIRPPSITRRSRGCATASPWMRPLPIYRRSCCVCRTSSRAD